MFHKFFTNLPLIIFIFALLIFSYQAVISIPMEGDSLAYHIPIAKGVFHGNIIHPTFYLGFYPSIGELILSSFIFLQIPLNLFNVLAIGTVFILSYYLGKQFQLSRQNSLWMALSIALLPGITRWFNAQVIDIWLLVFFLGSLLIFEKFKRSAKDYLLLGTLLGCLIGTKFSGILFALILVFVYVKKVLPRSLVQWTIVIIPIIIFGLSWYIRNLLIIGNPIYPLSIFGLAGYPHWNIFEVHVWQALISRPRLFFDGIVSEYLLWPFLALCIPFIRYKDALNRRLIIIGAFCFAVFLFLPTTYVYQIIVSSFRYGYVAIIPFIFILWRVAEKYHKTQFLIFITLGGLLLQILPMYHPKFIFLALLALPIFLLKTTRG